MHPVTIIQGKLVMNILNSMDAHVLYRWRPAPTFEGGLVVLVQDNLGENVHVGDVWRMRVCDARTDPPEGTEPEGLTEGRTD